MLEDIITELVAVVVGTIAAWVIRRLTDWVSGLFEPVE